MRCDDCQTEPPTRENFCECCGTELTEQDSGAVQTTFDFARADEPGSADDRAAKVACCETCGAPAVDGELCEACRQAFTALLDSPTPALTAAVDSAAVGNPEPVPIDESASPEPMASSAMSDDTVGAAAAAWAQQALPDMAPWKNQSAHSTKAPDAGVGREVPVVSHAPRRWTRPMMLAAGVVLAVAAVGAPQGARWFGFQWPLQAADREQSEPAAQPGTPSAADRAVAAASVAEQEEAPTPPATSATRPRPVALKPVETARPTSQPARQVAAVVESTPAPEPSGLDAPPPPPVPDPLPSPAPMAPSGRFFEAADVDKMPQIVARVEPQVPIDLAARPFNDIVVVRVLVSQSGHPFRVSLLRRSKLGPSLDDAVVDAVAQWRFSPALKRGEPVSSWYNIGLPLGAGQ